MIEHSCCCIWDFVMSGLNQIQFGFENPLKIGFEKFEKEKEKGIFFFGPHSPTAQCSPAAAAHFFFFPCAPPPVSWAEPNHGQPARLRARGRVPH
jgi:hypothetical protein